MGSKRNYIALSPEEQARRRPPSVGTLLSGIDTPIAVNTEQLVKKRLHRIALGEQP